MSKPHRSNKQPGRGDGNDGYCCRGRVWIEGRDGTFLGYGRVVLLERIRETGSISKAAKTMEMSYKHAWDLVDSMNRQAKSPLVEKVSGGRGGGGTRLTEAGVQAIESFWTLHGRLEAFLTKESQKLDF